MNCSVAAEIASMREVLRKALRNCALTSLALRKAPNLEKKIVKEKSEKPSRTPITVQGITPACPIMPQ